MSDDSLPPRDLSPYRILRDPLPDAPGWGTDPSVAYGMEEQGIHLRDYLRVVLKHRRMIAAIFVVAVISTGVICFTMEPRYTGSATLQIERQAPKVAPVQGVEQVESAAPDKYDYYQTQYEILGSRTIAARVIRELALEGDARFRKDGEGGLIASFLRRARVLIIGEPDEPPLGVLGVPSDLIDQYIDALSIEPVRNSRLVKLMFTSESAELAAEVANRHIDEYVASSLDQRLEMTLRAKEFLEAELAKAKERVDIAEVALNKFRKENAIVSLDGGRSDVVNVRLGDLNEAFTQAQTDRIGLEAQYQLIKSREYESLPDVLASGLVSQLKGEISKLEVERADLEKRYRPAFPKMKEAIAREAQAKQRLNAEVRKIVAGVESSYLAAKKREAELGRELDAQREKALHQKDVGSEYDTLQRDVETARGLYANLLERLKDVDVAEEIKVSNVVVVDRAALPGEPSSPRTLLNLALAAALGIFGGTGIAFLLEYLDRTVKTPEDVEQRLRLPSLGVIPAFDNALSSYGYGGSHARIAAHRGEANGARGGRALVKTGEKKPAVSHEMIVERDPRSVVAEAYRAVRTAILMSQSETPPQVVLFTSSAAGEGKTVTAVNQAITLAHAGGRVLLIDADIRKPRIHQVFNVPNGQGLSTYLAGQSELGNVIHSIPVNGFPRDADDPSGLHGALEVIPSGPLPPNPAELLGSRRMLEAMKILRTRYDYVIVDTPPVLPVTDAVLLARACDGVVLVVRGQETPLDVVAKSRDRLTQARAKILGVVLNDVDVTGGDYSDYYQYSYSYYASGDARDG